VSTWINRVYLSHSFLGCDTVQWCSRIWTFLMTVLHPSSPWRWRQHGPLKRWYPTTSLRCHTPEDHSLNLCCCGNPMSHKLHRFLCCVINSMFFMVLSGILHSSLQWVASIYSVNNSKTYHNVRKRRTCQSASVIAYKVVVMKINVWMVFQETFWCQHYYFLILRVDGIGAD